MKKRIAVLLWTVIFCLSMAGCTIEGMRNSQVFINEAGNIEWKGQEYILLNDDGRFNPQYDYSVDLYATKKDVPMLLQELEGMHIYPSIDGKFLSGWGSTYCRSDCYEEYLVYCQENLALEYYGYDYWQAEDHEIFILDEKQSQWLDYTMMEGELVGCTEEEFYEKDLEFITVISRCTQDMLVQEALAEIFREGDTYYIHLYPYEADSVFLCVPESDVQMLELILAPIV